MYIFDLEGTLSDTRHRMVHYINQDWDNWNFLFQADPIRPEIVRLFRTCQDQVHTMILTSKEEKYRAMVRNWLISNHILPDSLIMKPTGDKRTSPEFKLDKIFDMVGVNEVHMVFDDRRDVIDALLTNGIPAICVGEYNGQ